MKKLGIIILAAMLLGFTFSGASAGSILFDWAYYVDGATFENFAGDSMPTSGALDPAGLGTLTWSTNAAGSHTFIAFFDHEFDEAINTFFNEFGAANNSPAPGQSWEIDEPGYLFGDIYDNVMNGALDNSNSVPMGLEDDVSMAMGWDFSLAVGETAVINLFLADSAPASGFYLSHTDPESSVTGADDATIYFSSTLTIRGDGEVPEPATLLLLGSCLVALAGLGRRRFKKA